MKKNKKKNYYVMDECLAKRDMDQFGHKEIADNIINLIKNDTYQAPYNIALIGKWGLGKSSILKMMEEGLKNSNKNIKVISINAWKYERESLKKLFLKNIYEEVSEEKIDFIEQLENTLKKIFTNSQKQKTSVTEKIIIFLKIMLYFIISLVISFAWQFFHYIANGGNITLLFEHNIWFLICRYFNFYFENILFTLGVPILIKVLPRFLNKESNI